MPTTTQTLLAAYAPQNAQEAADRQLMLDLFSTYGDALLTRACRVAHITSSSMIASPDGSQVLMIYHNLYNSWAWTGGHADGEDAPLDVALREAKEETGLAHLDVLTQDLIAVDILPVWGHEKRGQYVSGHLHLNLSYAFCADPRAPLQSKPDENSDVRWLPANALSSFVTEPDMLPVYHKILRRMQKN